LSISKNMGWKVISEVNLKWGADQLYVVKGRELRWGRM
jgi:hypothetical protein